MNLEEVRNLFPHLKNNQIYFNHASIGPWSTLVLERIEEYAKQRSGQKVENFQNFLRWNASAKTKLGRLINAESDRIAWVDNVSNGLNILAQGLTWKTGDRIILNDMEFPSNVYPFLNLKKQGVEIDFVKSKNGKIEIEDIERNITPKTKLLSISLVQFLSGYRADINALGELCKNKGIIFCVDAIQGVGVVDVNIKESNIDFLIGGTQKWLMSMEGLSYFYVTEELQERIDQKFVGWTSVENAWNLLDYNLTLRKSADKFQNGTMNALGIAVFESMIDLFLNFGIENIERRILDNTNYFINKLNEIGLSPILNDVPEQYRAGIITFPHENSDSIFKQLEERKIFFAVREGMLRFSPHFYNTKDEIDSVIENLISVM